MIHLKNGDTSVVVVENSCGRPVREFDAGTYSSVTEAKHQAEDIALAVGVDALAFPGDWRDRQRATKAQRRKLDVLGIAYDTKLSNGQAGDEIALAVARGVDPKTVNRKWQGP